MSVEPYNTFHSHGYAADPSASASASAVNCYVGDSDALKKKRRRLEKRRVVDKEKGEVLDKDKEEVENPASDSWLVKNKTSPWAGNKGSFPTEEQKKYANKKAEEKGKEVEVVVDNSTFHGKAEKDYQAGMDTEVKIWDVYGSGKCMRTYMGHSKAVRDICFSNDGTKFLSAGYDKNIKYWDTETGQVISTFSTGKLPYVVKLNPDDDKQNLLLSGMSDKKIMQWDMNTGEITQEYDQHLGAVNTITFVDNNRRFITSSDDKSLRVWEFGIPVVIKYISEPHMHSMPAISVHPNSNWLAAQSLDNQILVYSTSDRFQLNKKKRFAGHISAGYACQVNFSPDGRFVMSGDGDGKMWFWDWKTCKVFRTLKCHQGVSIGCEWHPLEQSKWKLGFGMALSFSLSASNYPLNVVNDVKNNNKNKRSMIRSLPFSPWSSLLSSSLPIKTGQETKSSEPQKIYSSLSGPLCYNQENTVGIIGGVSVLSTLIFLEKFVLWSSRDKHETVPFIVCSDPASPSRCDYISDSNNGGISSGLDKIRVVENLRCKRMFLEQGGARCIVMPCHLSHAWYGEISQGCKQPFLHVADCVARELKEARFRPLEAGSSVKV
ncbi:hypothetical protein SOVF_115590 [Spinacia oleracea]|nr:hypothetical protein SOVF_115590 [Spinacia oleracea]